MKKTLKIIIFAFIFVSAINLIFSTATSVFSPVRRGKSIFTYFIVGFDDAAENTDVMLTFSYDSESNSISIIQIPRDTYVSYDDYEGKINGFFPSKLLEGKSRERVLSSLTERVSGLLGIPIEGYVGVTHSGFVNAVDSVGGIDIDIPCGYDNILCEEDASKKSLHLNGEEAYRFVRYRKGYLRGDLERMDAQKVFIKAAFKRVLEKGDILTLFFNIATLDGIFYDFSKARAIGFFAPNLIKIKEADLLSVTLQGTAREQNGIWYYFVDREKAHLYISSHFSSEYNGLDTEKHFVYNKN